MKILFAGNSQTACLKSAHDENPDLLGQFGDIHFYVTPGGTGPYFSVENDSLIVLEKNLHPKFPARAEPEHTPSIPISEYDLIIVSALGRIDGGFRNPSKIIQQGLIHQYAPKKNQFANKLLSRACFQKLIHSSFNRQPGIQFLLKLRKEFKNKILVQPFPLLAHFVSSHSNWGLNIMYHDPIGAHKFFCIERDKYLQKICKDNLIDLLPFPQEIWQQQGFTPNQYMKTSDGVHPNEIYGKMVLQQISDTISP